ncbi:MAG: hypothetical protein ACTIJH_07500 [Moraxellaceae bacterium]
MKNFKDRALACRGFITLNNVKDAINNAKLRAALYRLANTVEKMPGIYEQDGMGDDAVAYLHYTMGTGDNKHHWYILERDISDTQHQAFGLVALKGNYPELGYISINNILGSGRVHIDFNFEPTKLGDIKKQLAA